MNREKIEALIDELRHPERWADTEFAWTYTDTNRKIDSYIRLVIMATHDYNQYIDEYGDDAFSLQMGECGCAVKVYRDRIAKKGLRWQRIAEELGITEEEGGHIFFGLASYENYASETIDRVMMNMISPDDVADALQAILDGKPLPYYGERNRRILEEREQKEN